ncbi:MAG: hypothetical protein ACK4PH_18985 [Aquincola tertiaricarbonis]|uniref:hypothetical protein n=1 Tax=Aquincola tertiaricarbonis TaxID=391953 RepID=UPI0012EEA3E7|nr:hypothetical protein [Aquincola tertiaricarbonis]
MSPVLDSVAADEARLARLLDTYGVVAGRADAAAEAQAIAEQLALEMHAYSVAVRQALFPALPQPGERRPEDSDALASCEWLAARAAASDLSGPQRDQLVDQLRQATLQLAAHQRDQLWPQLQGGDGPALAAQYRAAHEAARETWKRLRSRGQPPEDEAADPVGTPVG